MTQETIDFIKSMADKQTEINQLEKKLEELKSEVYEYGTDGVSGSSKELPYAKHNITVAGFYQSPRVQKEMRNYGEVLQINLEKLYVGRTEAEKVLSTITDSKAKTIIRYRYIDGLEWRDVAAKMGHRVTEDGLRKYIDRFFEELVS